MFGLLNLQSNTLEYLIWLLCVVVSRVKQSIKAPGVPLSLSDKNDGKQDDLGEQLLWRALDLGLNHMQSFRPRCLWHHDIIQNFTELFFSHIYHLYLL